MVAVTNASRRTVRIGGASKAQLLAALEARGMELNALGRILFEREEFRTMPNVTVVQTIELSALELGCEHGGSISELCGRAIRQGLSMCPLELAPHLRLQYLDQSEGSTGFPVTKGVAPPGSITVASAAISDDDEIPKGFYLRKIEGVLWLRGYRSDSEHIYGAQDRFVFCAG